MAADQLFDFHSCQEEEQEIIAMDGKALRRSHDRRRGLGPLFLVSAWAVRRGIRLGQLATTEKSIETTAIPELLEQIDVTGAIVTIDAAGCQKEIARSANRRARFATTSVLCGWECVALPNRFAAIVQKVGQAVEALSQELH